MYYHDLAGCCAGAKVLLQYNIAQLLPLRERPYSVPSGSEPNSIVAREGVVGSTVDYRTRVLYRHVFHVFLQ